MSSRRDSETRKEELLEAATDLFLEKGYRDTSVSSIVKSIGVSKGTFYYYFESKEDVVDGLVEKFSRPIYRKIDNIIASSLLNSLEKINNIFTAWMQMELDDKETVRKIFYLVYEPENLRLRNKIQKNAVEETAPKITKVVRQGVEEGSLDTPFPGEVGSMILWIGMELEEEMANDLLSGEQGVSSKKYLRKFKAYENAIERMLGAPEGAIKLIEEEELRKFLSYLDRSDSTGTS